VARVALTAVGYGLGTLVGAPALGAWAGAMAGAYLFPEKEKERTIGYDIKNIQVQSAAYGVPIRKIWAGMRLAGNRIWSAPVKKIITHTDGTQVITYTVDLAISVCAGPIDMILRIWADNKLIYDVRDSNANIVQFEYVDFTIYPGTETQMPDSTIESYEGVGNVPAYRGLCYVLFHNLSLDYFGGHIPNFEFEASTNVDTTVDTFVPLDGAEASATDRDNIVFHPEELHFTIASNGEWRKFNTRTNDLVQSVDYSSPKIPAFDGGFDIDENNVIHTFKPSTGSQSVLCRLDGDSLAIVAYASLYPMPDTPQNFRIRVFRTSTHPYVVSTWGTGNGDKLMIAKRYDYTFQDGVTLLDPPSGMRWASFDLDEENGIIWAVCRSISGAAKSVYVRITVFSDLSVTQMIRDIVSYIEDCDEVMYDSDTDILMVGSSSQDRIIFFTASTGRYFTQSVINEEGIVEDVKSSWRRGTHNGFLRFAASQSTVDYRYIIYKLDLVNREIDESLELAAGLTECGDLGGYGGSCYCPLTASIILVCPDTSSSADYTKYYMSRGTDARVPLSSVVEDICGYVGFNDSDDLDTSELTDLIRGFVITQQMTAREAIEFLARAYFFDVIDSGGVLKFVKRGSDSTFTLVDDDMAAHIAGEQRPQIFISNRQQELELPESMQINYIDYDADYATATQEEQRLITQSSEKSSLNVPIVLDKDEAKQICVKHLANIWMQRTKHSFALSREFLYLDPADVGTITRGAATYTVRIEEIQIAGGLIIVKAVNENAAMYESDAGGADVPGDDDEIDYSGQTLLIIIDCPLIRGTENSSGVQIVTLGYGNEWPGAAIYKTDVDVWSPIHTWMLATKDAIVGKSLNTLADVTDPWIWDEGNFVNVLLLDTNDTLSSITKADVLNGSNMAILGDEIIQWRTATLESDGSYTLTGLLRGRRGTEWATGSHAVGEYFIPLDTSNIEFKEITIDEEGISRWYWSATIGVPWPSGYPPGGSQEFEFAANNMKPFSPERVEGTRDGSNNLTITWTRRTRMNGEWIDGGDVALGETSESYDIDVYDGSTVVRTIEATSETATYTAAQQTADGLTPGDQVDVIVYQISSVVDRGFGTEATV
jgi:hypothetical protein